MKTWHRVVLTSVVALALALALSPITAFAASARPFDSTYPGGCQNSSDGRIRVCVSENLAPELIPDFYINAGQSTCTWQMTLIDANHGIGVDSASGRCDNLTGWIAALYFSNFTHGDRYFNYVQVSGNAYTTSQVSPQIRP